MTISSTARKAGPFSGTGAQNAYPFNFKVFTASDVLVVQTDSSGLEHPLAGQYSVSLNSDQDRNPGGVVTLQTNLPAGNSLTISSAVPLTQGASIPNMGGFYPKVIEQALDKLTIAAQQISDAVGRSLRFALSDSNPKGDLPTATARAGRFLAFDAGGNPTAASGTGADAALRTDLASRLAGASLIATAQTGLGALVRTVRDKLGDYVSITDYAGVAGDGVTNCTDGICAAIENNLHVEIPQGVFVCAPTASSGDFMLYLGTKNGQASRDGLTIKGRGPKSVLKLGDNVGRNALLFGLSAGDSIRNLTIRDLTFDLNGLNNLQANFTDALRYNCAAYLFGYCENVLFENVTFLNASGHQVIRVGDDTGANYGKNIRVKNCHFYNYGMGVPGNKSQDTSALYIQADGIEVTDNTFENDAFTYDPARGHTAVELHGDSSTLVSRNRFRNCQMPWLMASSQKPTNNVTISENRYRDCFYFGSLDGSYYDQKVIDIGPGNIFNSTRSAAALLRLGNYAEVQKNRESVRFFGNQVMLWGNANEDVHFTDLTNCWVRSLEVFNNRFGGLNGSVVFYEGIVRNDGYCDISVHDNDMDSLGSQAGVYPNSPTFLHIETSQGAINTLTFSNNKLTNSLNKDYSAFGLVKLSGTINYVNVNGNKNALSSAFPLTTGTPACLYKSVDKNFPQVWQVGGYQSPGFTPIAPGGSLPIFDFSGWTKNDWTAFRVTVFATDGGNVNNGLVDYDVLVCGSGKVATRLAGTGIYTNDLSVSFAGSVLQINNANGSTLYIAQAIGGNSSRPVTLAN